MRDLVDINKRSDIIGKKLNEQAVLQAIETVLSVKKNSIPFNRDVGSNIDEILFEPFNIITKHALEFEIRSAIQYQLGNVVEVRQIYITQNDEKRTYEVKLIVEIKGIGETVIERSLQSQGAN